MDNDEHFQEIKEKEITRLTTPISYPKLGNFTFGVAARDCEGQPVPVIKTFRGNKRVLEPKPGILTDDEILMYAPESKAASNIRLKRGTNNSSDILTANDNITYVYSVGGTLLFMLGFFSLLFSYWIGVILSVLLLIIAIGVYIYITHIRDYADPQYAKVLKEDNNTSERNLSSNDELFLLFESKEKIAREMIEKKFPSPQLTNSKFNAVLDNCRSVVESQIEILNALTPTERTKHEISSRKRLIKQLISKIDDLTNELILSEENDIEEVIDEMDNLISTVKDY